MTMNMVEKVAIAINKAADDYLKDWHVKAGKDNTIIPYIGMADIPMDVLARAAIEAMKEPTEEMVKVGVDYALGASVSGEGGWPKYVTAKHDAMISAALKE